MTIKTDTKLINMVHNRFQKRNKVVNIVVRPNEVHLDVQEGVCFVGKTLREALTLLLETTEQE
jgi:hypothetical protein